ncbi:MAG: HNH endonuclease [Pseudomonadota bacterium]
MCIHCGDVSGGNLQAHHRKEWAEYPELRFDVNNGITLCKWCHWLAHTYHGCIPGLN